MPFLKPDKKFEVGTTLIEVMIFSVLLSLLISSLLNYLYQLQRNNLNLLDRINTQQGQGGFMATTAVVLLATGILAFSVITSAAAFAYSDSVTHREIRVQKQLNRNACSEYGQLVRAKDYFFQGEATSPDLDCTIH